MEASPPTRCGTPTPTRAQTRATERLARQILRQREAIGAASVSVPVVDVYFHVVSRGTTTNLGNVPQAWIEAQLNVLNAAYTGRVVFRGAGTSRTVNTAWNPLTAGSTAERNMKAATRRGTAASLNFWITTPRDSRGRELLGFAYLPPASLTWDGVVCGPFTLPTGSSLGAPYNLGDTGTHEVGHWLGLLHTFNGGCSSSGTNGGDLVSDTPAERSPTYNCANRDTCTSLAGRDSVKNYMNYGDDLCMNAFTTGQYTRMVNQWNAFRQGQ